MDYLSIMKDLANYDINQRIAARVRQLRTDTGLSLDALAQRCDVSRSMLSLVERGESNATAVVLEKIAAGLGVSLASLFDQPDSQPSPIARREDRQTWQDPDSAYLRRNISPPNFPSPIQIVDVELPAGACVDYESQIQHLHMHEQIWVKIGKLEVTVGSQPYTLGEDDCLAFPLNERIAFKNPESSTCHYLVVIANLRF